MKQIELETNCADLYFISSTRLNNYYHVENEAGNAIKKVYRYITLAKLAAGLKEFKATGGARVEPMFLENGVFSGGESYDLSLFTTKNGTQYINIGCQFFVNENCTKLLAAVKAYTKRKKAGKTTSAPKALRAAAGKAAKRKKN